MSDLQHETVPVEPPITTPAELEYAGFWRRVAAHLIDALALGMALLVLVLFSLGNNSLYLLSLVIPTVLGIVYQLYLTTRYGATLGKMAMDVKIVRLDGSPIGFTEANWRYLPYLIFGVIGLLGNFEAFHSIPVPSIFFELSWTERNDVLQQYQPVWATLSMIASLLFIFVDVVMLIGSKKKLSLHDRIGNTMVIKI